MDANVLVAVVNKEYRLYSRAARIVNLAGQKGYDLYTSPCALPLHFILLRKRAVPNRPSTCGAPFFDC
mgnify:CR=1 FL=1